MKLSTRLRSLGARYFSSPRYQQQLINRARKKRVSSGEPSTVHFFHQVDDPYSHLAVQKLDDLRQRYELKFQFHLTSKPGAAYRGSDQHFDPWALNDAKAIAANYGCALSEHAVQPESSKIKQANDCLAPHLHQHDVDRLAFEMGQALWSGEDISSSQSSGDSDQAIKHGNQLRERLGHYQGGMFYFEGEWFWGVDRIRHLEERLIEEGYGGTSNDLVVPQPQPMGTEGQVASNITIEYFPSLRSPYTAIGHQRVLDMLDRTGANVRVRPVMPMLMRGIPAPRAKQRYIITDAAREGRTHGSPLGKIVDPFGQPVLDAFALFPGAQKLGYDMAFITAYLQAAWHDGVDISKPQGLKQVAQMAGADWTELNQAAQDEPWQAILSENLEAMLTDNLWGVPSFRVSGGNQSAHYACWGQDRIWRVEHEVGLRTN